MFVIWCLRNPQFQVLDRVVVLIWKSKRTQEQTTYSLASKSKTFVYVIANFETYFILY